MQKFPAPQPEGILTGLRPEAVLLGVVVDVILSIIAIFITLAFFLDPDLWSAEEEVFKQAISALQADAAFVALMFLLGLATTVFGAYVGAKRAGVMHLKHGLAIAFLSAVSTLILILFDDGAIADTPLWYDIASWLFILPAGIFGGHLARKHQARASA